MAVAVLSAVVVAACGGSDGGEAAPDDAPAAEQEIDRTATLRFAVTHPSNQLDPHRQRDGSEELWNLPAYDRLLHVDADKEIQPMLAEAWEFSEDGRTLSLTIREGATFHDGSPIDAAAAKASLERAKALEGSTQAARIANIASVDAPDDRTLVIELSAPDSSMLATLASSPGAVINPAVIAAGTDIGQSSGDAGSGPYRITSYTPGNRAVYERYEGYWDPDAANFAKIELFQVTNQTTRLNGLRSGQYDGITLAETLASEAETVPGTTLEVYPGDSVYALFMKPFGPFESREVRQAVRYAIDREAIAEGLFDGRCEVADQPFRLGAGHIEDFEDPYTFDPERAKELLAEAGVADGVSVAGNLLAGASPQTELGEILQQQLGDVGIDLELTPLEAAEGVGGFRSGKFVAQPQVLIGRSSAVEWINQSILGAWNFAAEEGTAVAEEMKVVTDPTASEEEIDAAWADVVEEITEQAWYAPICYRDTYILWPDDIVNHEDMAQGWGVGFDFRGIGRTR